MEKILITGLLTIFCWTIFLTLFIRDRSRYRNCYFLFLALVSLVPFLLSISGKYLPHVALTMAAAILLSLLVVPFFLIYNGIIMIRKEGKHLSQLLSLMLGIVILAGETVTIHRFFASMNDSSAAGFSGTLFSAAGTVFSVSVIYGSMSFLIFMIYTLFLQIIPRKKDFDYVIIHGAGLLDGDRVSKLLQDRLDKAIEVYRQDPTPPRMIPSGGKGADETISEAEAMKRYLVSQGIPETDILPEDSSTTTLENLQYSADILNAREGRKYTALVTSNYHVYRALRYSKKIGLKCTGIGSHVAFYYWPSALIREYIAIHLEKKHAILFVIGWVLAVVTALISFLPVMENLKY